MQKFNQFPNGIQQTIDNLHFNKLQQSLSYMQIIYEMLRKTTIDGEMKLKPKVM